MTAAGLDVVRGATVNMLVPRDDACQVDYSLKDENHAVSAQLAVLADGGRSLNSIQHLKRKVHEYQQHALVAHVETELPHDGVAYERFTPNGPVALLPWGLDHDSHGYALVWTASPERAAALCELQEQEFLSRLHEHFGDRLGRFVKVTGRSVFPLKMAWVRPVTAKRIAVIGNAAQTLHPVAGQGFNLGVRDAWSLAQTILDAPRERLGEAASSTAYTAKRRFDILGGSLMTDILVEAFSNDRPLLGSARGAALALLDLAPPLKTLFARKMMFGAQAW